MSDYRLKIGDFAPTGPVDPKFQVEGVAPTNDSFSQKTRLHVMRFRSFSMKRNVNTLVTVTVTVTMIFRIVKRS